MSKDNKVIAMYSPLPQTGQTTLATLVGLDLAIAGKYVVVIELSRTTGFSTYLNKNLGEYKRDLKSCLVNPSELKENLVKSQHNARLFYVSQNAFSTLADLTSYNPANIDEIITYAKELFDYIILDLPSNPEEVSTVQVFGRNFTHEIDHVIYSITENVIGLKRLNDFDTLLSQTTKVTEKVETTLVINKSKGRYAPFYEPYLKNLPKSKLVNIVNVMNVDELPYLCNEGNITKLGKTSEAKEFFSNINILTKVILEGKTGIGMKKEKETGTKQKLKGSKLTSIKDKTNKDEKDKNKQKTGMFKKKIIRQEDVEYEDMDLEDVDLEDIEKDRNMKKSKPKPKPKLKRKIRKKTE